MGELRLSTPALRRQPYPRNSRALLFGRCGALISGVCLQAASVWQLGFSPSVLPNYAIGWSGGFPVDFAYIYGKERMLVRSEIRKYKVLACWVGILQTLWCYLLTCVREVAMNFTCK